MYSSLARFLHDIVHQPNTFGFFSDPFYLCGSVHLILSRFFYDTFYQLTPFDLKKDLCSSENLFVVIENTYNTKYTRAQWNNEANPHQFLS